MNFDKIRAIREDNDLTQLELANKLNIKRSTYSLWEINKNIIPLIKLNEFCNMFNVNMDYVVGLTNVKKKVVYNKPLDKVIIGKKIKQVRKELNITQVSLAKKFNTTHSAISAYENGIILIPTILIIEFAKITGKSLDWLCSREEEKVEIES